MDQLPEMLRYLLDHARALGVDKDVLGQIELGAEEALVNIIQYAYANGSQGSIQISCVSSPTSLKITIQDQGSPFDPLARGQGFDPEAVVRSGVEGGFGIFLMTKMMDQVTYERKDESNILTLIKHIAS